MSPTWTSATPPDLQPPRGLAWARVIWRGAVVGGVTYGCLVVLLLVRLIERPLFGWHRPVTPFITQFVCRFAFAGMGMRLVTHGRPMRQRGAIVANHASWLDIFALNAPQRIYFVAKDDVAGWPGIGWLARATGTVFIARRSADAGAQKKMFEDRLEAGHKLVFFPEGTSSDGLRVLQFKSTLFAAFFSDHLKEFMHVQPVSVTYGAPPGADPRFYGWWGDMGFGAHLLHVLAHRQQGRVDVTFHDPVRVADFPDRKALAAYCEQAVRSGVRVEADKTPDVVGP